MAIRLIQRSAVTPAPAVAGAQFLTASIEKEGNLTVGLGGPPTERAELVSTRAHQNRVYASGIHFAASYNSGHYDGQTAYVYIVKNGRRELLRKSVITATKTWPKGDATPFGKVVTGTSYEWGAKNYYRAGGELFFSVRAVAADGSLGARSAWARYVLPNPIYNRNSGSALVDQTMAEGGSLTAPANVSTAAKTGDPSVAVITWDAVAGAAGYIVDLLWQDPSVGAEDEYIELAPDGPPVPAGAHVLIEGKRMSPPTTITGRIWQAGSTAYYRGPMAGFNAPAEAAGTAPEFVAYHGADPAPNGIDAAYFVRATASPYINYPLHSGSADSAYPKLEPGRTYKLRLLMRAQAATTLTMSLASVQTGASDSYNVTTNWQWFETDVAVSQFVTGQSPKMLTLSGAGEVDFAAVEFFDTALDKDDLAPSQKARVLPGTYLRDHRQIKPGFRGSGMAELTARNGFGPRYSATLHGTLRHCQINNLKPWLQVEWHSNDQEWLDFVAYLTAPVASGHPMAAKRAAQGQSTPWTDVFPDMILEIGNESWLTANADFWNTPSSVADQVTGQTIPGDEMMGMICDNIVETMQQSPWWPAFRSATKLLLGGHFHSTFGADAAAKYPDLDYLATAAYTGGGWDNGGSIGTENGATFSGLLGYVAGNTATTTTRISEATALGKKFAIYENGPAYFNSGVSAAQVITQEVVAKSRAMGTADLDAMCNRLVLGTSVDCFFRLGEGNFWQSHASGAQGGGTYLPYGLRHLIYGATGPAHVTRLNTAQTPTRPDGSAAIDAYMFTSAADASNRVIVAVNRQINPALLETSDPDYSATPGGTEALTITTGIASCTGLRYFANVGNFREHNRYPVGQRLDVSGSFVADPLCVAMSYDWTAGTALADASSIAIDDTYGAVAAGLPAGNCLLLHLTGCE